MAIRRWAKQLNPEVDDPLPAIEVMRDNMRYWHQRARDEALTLRLWLEAHGATPDQMLKFIAMYHRSRERSQDVARDLIPYETPRLTQVTLATLNLNDVGDADLNAALVSLGLDLEELERLAVADTDILSSEVEPAPRKAA